MFLCWNNWFPVSRQIAFSLLLIIFILFCMLSLTLAANAYLFLDGVGHIEGIVRAEHEMGMHTYTDANE